MSVATCLTVLVNANVKYHKYILEKEHSTVSLFLFSDLWNARIYGALISIYKCYFNIIFSIEYILSIIKIMKQ